MTPAAPLFFSIIQKDTFATYSIQLVLVRGRVGEDNTITEGPHMLAGANSFAYVGPPELVCKGYVSFLDYPNMECRTLERGTIYRNEMNCKINITSN